MTSDLVARARSRLRRMRRALLTPEQLWSRELATEVDFWRKVLTTKGLHWPWAYERGIDPAAPILDPLILRAIDALENDPVRILDVGAGPLTAVGKVHPERTLEIVPTDALAHEYDRLLTEVDVEPPIRTQQCSGEDLLAHFGPDRFDIAYARNSVDHTADPVEVIRNMVGVVRSGGFVLLRHYEKEAEVERYEELHQWNFELRDGRLILWSRRATHDLSSLFSPLADIEVTMEHWSDHAPWVACAMRKR